jgi:hypothetical protein
MQDVNVSDDLWQLSLGQVNALKYDLCDINGYCLRTAKLEASHPLAATTNSRVVVQQTIMAYFEKIIEYTFRGAKEIKVVFFNVIGLIQSMALEWMILVWWRWSTNRVIQATIFCLYIKRSRCTT